MNRFPPTLGIVGYDFGFKPAFSVAALQSTTPVKQQAEDPTCVDGDYQLTFAGLTICGCLSNGGGNSGGTTSVQWDVTMVLDGVYTVTLTNGDGNVGIGTNTPVLYSGAGCTGTPLPSPGPIGVNINLHCVLGLFSCRMFAGAGSSIIDITKRYAAFFFGTNISLGGAVNNECVTCDVDLPNDAFFALKPFTSATGGSVLVEAL